jgi:hypothetical protein
LGYISTTTFLKLAIGAMILRVAISRTQIIIVRIIMVLNALYGIGLFFAALFQCAPVSNFWEIWNTEGACNHKSTMTALAYAHSGLGVVSEWTLVAIPILLIWKSAMDHRVKVYAVCVVSFGAM